MLNVPDLVKHSQLVTRFHPEYTIHIEETSGNSPAQRRIRKEARWKRDKILGGGSYGVVWLSRKLQDGSTRSTEDNDSLRAVKAIRKHDNVNYHRELETTAWFSHPKYAACFAKSYGWYENDSTIFITMEYFPKGDLRKYIANPLPEMEAQEIVFQLIEGLDSMHQNGFTHRDLKPDNILVQHEGPAWWVKIADFGISKRAAEGNTALRTPIGTLAYTAPEVFTSFLGPQPESTYTNAVDVWSLGVISFQILTGKILFQERGLLGQYVAGTFAFPRAPLTENNVSNEGCDFVLSLLHPRPEHRPQANRLMQQKWLIHLNGADVAPDNSDNLVGEAFPQSQPSDSFLEALADLSLYGTTASATWSSQDASTTTLLPTLEPNGATVEPQEQPQVQTVRQQFQRPPAMPTSPKTAILHGTPKETSVQGSQVSDFFDECDNLVKQGKYLEAVALCNMFIRSGNMSGNEFRVLLKLGRAHFLYAYRLRTASSERADHVQSAQQAYAKSLDFATSYDNKAWLYFYMGVTEGLREDYKEAERFLLLALENKHKSRVEDFFDINILHEIGLLKIVTEQDNNAERYLILAKDVAIRLKLKSIAVAKLCHDLGRTLLNLDKYKYAEIQLREAISLYEEFSASSGLPTSLFHLGRVVQLQRRYQEAEALYQRVLNITEANNRGVVQLRLGQTQLSQNKYEQAEHSLLEAYNKLQQDGHDKLYGWALTALGEVYLRQLRYNDAAQALKACRSITKKFEDAETYARTKKMLLYARESNTYPPMPLSRDIECFLDVSPRKEEGRARRSYFGWLH